MATGLFNLKQINQAAQRSAWPTPPNYVGTFDGSTQYLFTPTSSNLTLGTGDFTIECWVYIPALATRGVFQTTSAAGFPGSQSGIGVYLGSSGNWNVYFGGANYTPASVYSANQWMHIAVCRSSTTSKFFVNGVSLQSITDSTNYTQSYFAIGGFLSTSYLWAGQITNFRVLKGTALYTTDFSPPTNRLTAITNTQLLTLQDSTIVDNSTNNFTLTNTGTVATSLQYPFSSFKTPAVDFLVVAGGGGAGAAGPGGAGAGGVLVGTTPVPYGSTLTVTVGAGGGGTSGSSAPSNGSNSVFGSQVAIGGGKGANNSVAAGSGGSGGGVGSSLLGAGQGTANQGFRGGDTYVSPGASGGGGGAGGVGQSPFRFNVGGQGGNGLGLVITGTMSGYGGGGAGSTGDTGTGTSSPGTAYGGGGIRASGNGGSGDANTGGGGSGAPNYTGGSGGSGIVVISYPDVYAAPVSTTGATVSTSGSGSIKFYDVGGSSPSDAPSYIQYTGTSALAIGQTGTYEFWIYPTRFFTNHRIISQGVNSGIEIYYDSSGNLFVGITSGGASSSVTGALSLNTWTHVAVVFTSGTLTVYFNGTAKSLSGTTTGYNMTSTSTLAISGYPPITGQYGVVGYLSNVRIVKGVAVYTGAFTPPSAPLQATQVAGTNTSAITGTQTSLLLSSVSGSYLADTSTNSYIASAVSSGTALPVWNASSPFTVTGYKNRVYKWTSSGSITF